MHQSTKILTLTLLSSMMIACGNPVKERSHVVAPASLVMSNMAADSTRKMIAPAAYMAAMPSPESVRLEQDRKSVV